jgi:hypothetical protein
MSPLHKGLILGAAQLLIVSALGGQLLLDRARLPHVWVQTAPVDPNLPIRGRYVSLRLIVEFTPIRGDKEDRWISARLYAANGRLAAAEDLRGHHWVTKSQTGPARWMLAEPVAYYIPEHAADPSRLKAGEELWVDCTIPKNGPPRPIRLGIRRAGGEIEPIGAD